MPLPAKGLSAAISAAHLPAVGRHDPLLVLPKFIARSSGPNAHVQALGFQPGAGIIPMQNRTLTTKTNEEINAGFDAVFAKFATSKPEKPLTPAQWLKPYKKAVMKQRRRGIPWEEIARGMGDPRIGVTVSERLLRQVFGAKEKAAKARRASAKRAAKPVPPAPLSAPAPTTIARPTRLAPRYQPVFDRVAPTIIRKACGDDVAKRQLLEAATADLRCDVGDANAFTVAGMAELDALDRDTAIAIYNIRPDDWDTWRPQWCELRGLRD